MTTMPEEILRLISRLDLDDRGTLAALLQTCRRCYKAGVIELYRIVDIDDSKTAMAFLSTIGASPTLAMHVKSLFLTPRYFPEIASHIIETVASLNVLGIYHSLEGEESTFHFLNNLCFPKVPASVQRLYVWVSEHAFNPHEISDISIARPI